MQCIGYTGPVRTRIFAPEFASDRRKLTRFVAILREAALEAMLYHQEVGTGIRCSGCRWMVPPVVWVFQVLQIVVI